MAGVPIMSIGPQEDEEERKRREQAEINRQANEAANAAFLAQQANAAPALPAPAPVVAPPAQPSTREAMGIPDMPSGAMVPMPEASDPSPPATRVKRPGTDTPIAPVPANAGATITQRGPGGTSIQMPLGGGDLDQRTSRGGTTRTQREVSKAEREAEGDLAGVQVQKLNLAEEKKENLVALAKEEQAKQDQLQAVAAAKEADTNQRIQQYEAEIVRRQAIADQTESEYKAQLQDFQQTNPKKRFWAKQDTVEKLTGGMALLLGIVGGLKDGSNVGAERILKAIDADTARARDVLEAKERMVASAKGDVQTAKDDIRRHKDLIDLRSAVAKERVVAEAEARAAKLGIPKAQIEGNEGMLLIRESAARDRLKLEQDRAATVQSEQAWSRVSTATGGGPAGADKPLAKWSAAEKEAEGFAQRMASASSEMDKHQYTPADIQALQNAAFQESVLPKGANAVANRLFGQVFQRLSPEGKKRWLAEQEFARANLRRESGAAISIQETLSEIEQVGARPGDNAETAAMKKQQRLLKVRATGISSGRPTYWEGVTREQAAAQPSGPPAGARPGKVNGAPAWIFPDGTYEPR